MESTAIEWVAESMQVVKKVMDKIPQHLDQWTVLEGQGSWRKHRLKRAMQTVSFRVRQLERAQLGRGRGVLINGDKACGDVVGICRGHQAVIEN